MNRALILCAGPALAVALGATARGQSIPSVPGLPTTIPGVGGAGAIPGLGGGAVPGVGSVAGAAAAPATAQPATLWNFLGLSKGSLAACKAKFCQSQLGQMVNNGLLPISGITGGLVGQCCPTTPNAAQLAAAEAAGGAEGVAAKIKAEEAGAKARIAAIEYLATVDCTYWPDAAAALIERLRADRNECVRYAAARALGTGCCCTKKTIAALTLVVECSDEDGNPAEQSDRVKAAAYYALNHCLGRYVPAAPEPKERPTDPSRREYPASYRPTAPLAAAARSPYEARLARTTEAAVLARARAGLEAGRGLPLGGRTLPTGSRSLAQAMTKASIVSRPAAPRRTAADLDPIPPAAPAQPPARVAEVDTSLRRSSYTADPRPKASPRSLLELINASRRPRSGE